MGIQAVKIFIIVARLMVDYKLQILFSYRILGSDLGFTQICIKYET